MNCTHSILAMIFSNIHPQPDRLLLPIASENRSGQFAFDAKGFILTTHNVD
jgi:hypothetical protein